MAKKALSLLLSCALVLTCFSGIALMSVSAEEQFDAYVWLEVDDATGAITGNYTALTNAGVEATATEIPNIGGYGIQLDTSKDYWKRLDLKFDPSGLPTDGREVRVEFDYYITSSFTANDKAWPVMGFYPGTGTVPQAPNMLTASFKNLELATYTYTYTEAEIADMQAKASTNIMLFPSTVAWGGMWIKGIRVMVEPKAEEGVYAWFDTEGGKLTGKYAGLTNGGVEPTLVEIPNIGGYGIKLNTTYFSWLNFQVDTTKLPTDGRSVTLVMEYYINSSFTANDAWPTIGFHNGVGTAAPQSPNMTTKSFVNKQVALFFHTYTAEDIATMRNQGTANIMLLPGDVGKNMYIKSMRLVDTATMPYAWFEVDNNGNITGKYNTLTNASVAPVATEIPDIGGYGIKLDTTGYFKWLNLNFDPSGLPTDGYEVKVEFDYYITSSFGPNDNWPTIGFHNGVGGNTPQSPNMGAKSFVNRQLATYSYTYTADEVATMKAQASANIMLFPGDVAKHGMWIKGIRIVTTPIVEEECTHETTTVEGYVAPTCTAVGSTGTEVCSACGETVKEAEEIAALPHTPVSAENAKDATCTEPGAYADTVCDVCGTTLEAGAEIPALNHPNKTTTTVDATCTVDGSITVTCDDCGATLSTEVIKATGHIDTTTETVNATCTTPGSITVTCKCGEVVSTQEIAVLPHTPVSAENGKDATCTEPGAYADTVCDVCGTTLEAGAEIPALNHPNKTTTTVDATCTVDGSITVTCDDCGATLSTDVIPATGHKAPELTETWNAKQYCGNDCGTVLYDLQALLNAGGEVDLDRNVETDASLVIENTVVLNLNGYSISSTEKDTVGNGVFLVMAGGDLTINGEGTIEAVGGSKYAMAVWAYGGKVTINGGTYTNVGAGEDDQYDLIYAQKDGEIVINGGTFISETPVWTLNSHDTKKGTFIVTGGKFFNYNPADNTTENPTKVWVAEGYDAVLNGEYYEVIAHVHTEVTDKAVDATCTTDGLTEGSHCSGCGEVFVAQTVIPATGHINKTTTTVDATCTVDGSITVTCKDCGATLSTEVIKATGHDEGTLEGAYDATEDATGYTGDLICGKCGGVIEEGKVIPQLSVEIKDGRYYVGGVLTPYAGLVAYGEDIYYIGNAGCVVTGRFNVSNTNDMEGFVKGYYYFDGEGKLVTEDGVYGGYYYKGGYAVSYVGAVKTDDGNVYYVQSQGALAKGRYATAKANDVLAKGTYYFGTDGVMQTNVVVNYYYYGQDGRCVAYRGLVKVGEAYYYVGDYGKVITGRTYTIKTTNNLLPQGKYTFNADGTMVVD